MNQNTYRNNKKKQERKYWKVIGRKFCSGKKNRTYQSNYCRYNNAPDYEFSNLNTHS